MPSEMRRPPSHDEKRAQRGRQHMAPVPFGPVYHTEPPAGSDTGVPPAPAGAPDPKVKGPPPPPGRRGLPLTPPPKRAADASLQAPAAKAARTDMAGASEDRPPATISKASSSAAASSAPLEPVARPVQPPVTAPAVSAGSYQSFAAAAAPASLDAPGTSLPAAAVAVSCGAAPAPGVPRSSGGMAPPLEVIEIGQRLQAAAQIPGVTPDMLAHMMTILTSPQQTARLAPADAPSTTTAAPAAVPVARELPLRAPQLASPWCHQTLCTSWPRSMRTLRPKQF